MMLAGLWLEQASWRQKMPVNHAAIEPG